jgi:hypothetical protein
VSLDIVKRLLGRPEEAPPPVAEPTPDGLIVDDHELKLTYRAKTSQGVRMTAGPNALAALPNLLADVAHRGRVTVVPPIDSSADRAAPDLLRPELGQAWLHATHDQPPEVRHGMFVLAVLDAFDPAFETIVLAQLAGETDTAGYPEYDAIMGGVISHWDEQTGDMLVRGITAWGGKGVRGDTDRNASRLLGALFTNILGSKDAVGIVAPGVPMPKGGPGGLVCGHCGFAAAHERAFYCPKCGMRMVRG